MAKSTSNRTPGHGPSGLPNPMPKAPGNAKAGQPPARRELGGALPAYLDPANAKWTKERVAATLGHQRPPKIGPPDVSDLPDAMGPHIPAVPGYQVQSPVKLPKREF
jgi:hypothetical protein